MAKVNRCLAEGRRSFIARMEGIESGAECERLAPQLSALADREAGAADLATLRPHLRTCLACRARLREFRAVPAQIAMLVPPAALVAGGEDHTGALRGVLESLVGATQHKAAALGERAHGAIELATGQKAAAVAASAAALAGGGGAALDRLGEREAGAVPAPRVEKVKERQAPPPSAPNPEPAPPASASEPAPATTPAKAPAPSPAPAPPPPPPPRPDPAAEFAPSPATSAPAPAAPARPAAPAAGEFAPGGGGGGGGGEFGP